MDYRTRERPMRARCPRCRGGLLAIEAGITPAELERPTSWVRMRVVCPRNCLLAADDVDADAT